MMIPKRGEKGFTLIELLIVVAILGVLAAIVIPNVGRFLGRGEDEARRTERDNIQTAVIAAMSDNNLTSLPAPIGTGLATNAMTAFPDTSTIVSGDKATDPTGAAYTDGLDPLGDKDGYLLYGHDITGNNAQTALVNYVTMSTTKYWYTVDPDGIVHQWSAALAAGTEYTD